jgi:Ala-tRNA(Pro) deacylase
MYERLEYPSVFTCEEANRYHTGIEAVHTKNLFLCDKKKRHFFLVETSCEKTVRLDNLAARFGLSHLRLASEADLEWGAFSLSPVGQYSYVGGIQGGAGAFLCPDRACA